MGKPFITELSRLSMTYEWAKECSIDGLVAGVSILKDLPLVCVGSGGSLTAAAYMAMLHEHSTGYPSKHVTPLELATSPSLRDIGVVMLTARGSHPDVIHVCERVAVNEPRAATVVVLAHNSKVASIVGAFPWMSLVEFKPPTRRDGFLATNSLLAMIVLLYRAYSEVFDLDLQLPHGLPEASIVGSSSGPADVNAWNALVRPTLSVLYGGWGRLAALDLESKFTEAGLANVQCADYRNFAHGRHHWLVRHPDTTTTLAIVTPEMEDLSRRTLALLPSEESIIRMLASHDGPLGGIEVLLGALRFTQAVASAKGIDPGRPQVPTFGRRLYRLRTPYRAIGRPVQAPLPLLQRKLGDVLMRWPSEAVQATETALSSYLDKLRRTRFRGILFDYDGTLCPTERRFDDLPDQVSRHLNKLLKGGVVLGIATGRGRSVRAALRASIAKELWHRLIVGYYNGGEIHRLDGPCPDRDSMPPQSVLDFYGLVNEHPQLPHLCKIEMRPPQITLSPVGNVSGELVHRLAMELVYSHESSGLSVVRSGHSVDILAPGVSKLRVLEAICDLAAAESGGASVLCVGDSGAWDGNDVQILATRLSVSVRESPLDASSAWNIAPLGHRGVQATVDYLDAMQIEDGLLRLDVDRLAGDNL